MYFTVKGTYTFAHINEPIGINARLGGGGGGGYRLKLLKSSG